MIIEWTGDGIKIIPCLGAEGQAVGKVVLQPGKNDVPKNDWASARRHVLDEIKNGDIKENIAAEIKEEIVEVEKEVEKEVEVVDPKTKEITTEMKKVKEKVKEKQVKIKTKEFSELDIPEAIEIVKDTYNLDTLKNWEKAEGRNSVRAEIRNQIEMIENYKGEPKKDSKEKKNK